MCVRVSVRLSIVSLVSAGLLSCASLGPVRGIPPSIQATDVETASSNVERILYGLRADSQIGLAGPGSWYLVSEAGFNFIDDRCSEYFYSLFRLNRRREAVKSGLGAFGQTTNAILEATGATSLSMTVVAQAFGLATSMTDIVAGTYLYQLPPATTREFVNKMQRAFREGAARDKGAIETPTAAYHMIQDYLSLCLPPTIEARLVGHVADATAVGDAKPGGNIDVLLGSQNEPAVAAALRVPNQPLPGTATTATATVRPRIEASSWNVVIGCGASIDVSTAKKIQEGLCLPENKVDGSYGEETAASLKLWQATNTGFYDAENWQNVSVRLCQTQINDLRKLSCRLGASNYLENWLLSEDFIPPIAEKLGLPNTTRSITSAMREKIGEYRTAKSLDAGPSNMFRTQITPDLIRSLGAKLDRE